jgi:hypothetical protein
MRFPQRTRSAKPVLALLLPVSLMLALTACSNHAPRPGTGTIVGTAPLCYGPGPNMNLHPDVTIRAVRTDGVTREVRVQVANFHNRYRMALPAGTYTISAYSGHVTAVVQANRTTTGVDLPQPGCL